MILIRVRCWLCFNGAGKMLFLRARQLRVSQLFFDMEALCLGWIRPGPRSYIATLQLALQRSGDKKRPKHGADGGGHGKDHPFLATPSSYSRNPFVPFTAASKVAET